MQVGIGVLKDNFPEHKHNFYEIIIYTDGTGYLQADSQLFPVCKGSIVIVPPGTLHCTVSENPLERIFINQYFDQFLNISKPVAISCGEENDGLTLARLIYQNRYHNTEYLAALLNAFVSFILAAIELEDEMSATIRSITNEIAENFHNPSLNLSELLHKSGYSEDYIRAQFKKKTGKTPVRFLTEVQIAHACMLIDLYQNLLPLSEIAEKCGYTDYVYFSRRFKEIKGISPRGYKK